MCTLITLTIITYMYFQKNKLIAILAHDMHIKAAK